jgi:hypothetical protein
MDRAFRVSIAESLSGKTRQAKKNGDSNPKRAFAAITDKIRK